MISQSKLVETFFGYWPEFADGHIERFAWVQRESIELEIYYGERDLGKAAWVGLLFTGIKDIDLTDFLPLNVLDCLRITHGEMITVELEPCYGLGGTFTCTKVEVTRVVPNSSFKPTPLRGAA
jgi:hypothetical protein